MPVIFELFGYPIENQDEDVTNSRKQALCPFMEVKCDGGGNRNQTKILLKENDSLSHYFDRNLDSVIPGICSIVAGEDIWVVCPRRLFAVRNITEGVPEVNRAFQAHERDILLQTELPKGQDIGIWSEVYVKQQVAGAEINYHFDYIAAPLTNMTLRSFLGQFNLSNNDLTKEIKDFGKQMKKKGYYKNQRGDISNISIPLPVIEKPYIFEVMTASTSGSDTENETDIRGAFRNAILGNDHESPGINKRQVWGRMVTQLFAKTALAHFWGGQTLWIIQDELLRNIELTTLLRTSKIANRDGSDIRLIIMYYKQNPLTGKVISLKTALTGDSGLDFKGDETFTDILLPKIMPEKLELARAMLRRSVDAIVNL